MLTEDVASRFLPFCENEVERQAVNQKEGMKASEFTLFERLFVIFVEIELCERKTWIHPANA